MWLIDILQIAGTETPRNISIPDTWFYGVINGALLGIVIWGIIRWIGKMDAKMDKTDATLNRIEDVLILHGEMHVAYKEMFKTFISRFEKIEERLEKRRPS